MGTPPAGLPVAIPLRVITDEIGVDLRFLGQLLNAEDDWSFVIKLSGLLEAAFARTILMALRDRRGAAHNETLEAFVMKMPFSSKIRFARRLGLLDEGWGPLLNVLSEMRNSSAHYPRMTGRTIDQYLAGRGAQTNAARRDFVLREVIDARNGAPPTIRYEVFASALLILGHLGGTVNNLGMLQALQQLATDTRRGDQQGTPAVE